MENVPRTTSRNHSPSFASAEAKVEAKLFAALCVLCTCRGSNKVSGTSGPNELTRLTVR